MEFALAATVLLTLIFGIFETAQAIYSYNVVVEVSRQATRYAIVRGATCTVLTDCGITSAQMQTHLRGVGYPAIVASKLNATTTWATAPGAAACSIPACNGPGDQVTVKISYSFPFSLPFLSSLSRTLAMSSTSAMIISN